MKREAMARATFYLPVEMTIDILSRLPVKSLLRFKSVCKTWYALIETPNFISKRLQIQSTLNSSSLLVNTWNWGTQKNAMSLLFNDGFNNGPVNLDFPFLDRSKYFSIERQNSFYDISIAGICDGLVCIFLSRSGYPLVLCNPLTRKFRGIPHFKWNQSNGVHHGYISVLRVSFGFGFHPSANGYKLTRIVFYFRPTKGGDRSCKANLYVVSTNTWTEIDDKKLSLFTQNDCVRMSESSASVVLNGVFYWQAHEVGTSRVILVSFDMGDEVFSKIRTPPCLGEIRTSCLGRNLHGLQFMELKDKVALVFYPDDKCLDVWVLNKDHSSWTNQFKVESFPRIASNVGSGENGEIRVVGFAKNDELLVTDHKVSGDLKLFLFDPNTQETMDLYFGQVPHPCSIYLYAKTLLPVMQRVEVMLNRKNNKSKH